MDPHMTFTDLCHEGSHLQSQLFVHGEVTLMDFIIHLVRQEEALSLRLSLGLSPEAQPACKNTVVVKLVYQS